MHVAVAIVGFRNPDDIVRCLNALEDSSYRDFEVIICENGGAAAYSGLVAKVSPNLAGGQPVRMVEAPFNLGYAGGVNVCLQQTAAADAWWILNPDTCPDKHALSALVARLSAEDCDAVGGTVYFCGGVIQSQGGHWSPQLGNATSLGYGRALDDPIDRAKIERALSYLSGASMMVGRRFLQSVGFMREDYFLYCEEVEWFLRGKARGMRLGFADGAKVLHYQGTTTGSVADITKRPWQPVYLDTRNRILVTRDCFPGWLPLASLAIILIITLRFCRRRAWRQIGYAFAGWTAGLRNERGPVERFGRSGSSRF
jgi:GT2 family glycosyltransferase